MYSNSIYIGPKVLIQGLLSGQSIYYLVTWTLRARFRVERDLQGIDSFFELRHFDFPFCPIFLS